MKGRCGRWGGKSAPTNAMITFRKSCGLQRCSWQASKSQRHASTKEDILCRISPPAPLSKSREFVVLRASDGKEITASLEEYKKTNQIVSKFSTHNCSIQETRGGTWPQHYRGLLHHFARQWPSCWDWWQCKVACPQQGEGWAGAY